MPNVTTHVASATQGPTGQSLLPVQLRVTPNVAKSKYNLHCNGHTPNISSYCIRLVLSLEMIERRAHRPLGIIGKQMTLLREWLDSETEPFRNAGIG